MSRLDLLTPEKLSEAQSKVYESLTEGERGKRASLVNEDGSLVGPFNAMLYSPSTGDLFQALGAGLRFENQLPLNQLEIVILVIAAEWRAEFEWWAHERLAREAGVAETHIAAIKRKQHPDFTDPGEHLVYRVATELLIAHQLSDETYQQAVRTMGEAGLVDLQMLMAYYTGVSMLLNTFRVELPAGVPRQF